MTGTQNFRFVLGILGLAILGMVLAAANPTVVDDTYITFHYARNLVDSGQLTWWPGGQMVDGYTSLGHVLLLSALYGFGFDLLTANGFLNIGLAAILAGLVLWQTTGHSVAARLAALALVVLNSSVAFWVVGGLDGLLYAIAVFLVYVAFDRAVRGGGLSWLALFGSALLLVTRPEGLVILPGILVFYWLVRAIGGTTGARDGTITIMIFAVACALIGWRYLTYGHVFPNTFYAKSSGSLSTEIVQGFVYVKHWVLGQGGFVLLLTPLVLIADRGVWFRLLFVLGYTSLVIVEGGDPHPAARFMLPLIPLLALDLARLVDSTSERLRLLGIVVASAYFLMQMTLVLIPDPVSKLQKAGRNLSGNGWPFVSLESEPSNLDRAAAIRQLSASLKPGVALVGTDVGMLAYYSDREILDAAGLNNFEIAHMPKPEGHTNPWGSPGLPVLLEKGAPFVQLGFPFYEGWHWAQNDKSCNFQLFLKSVNMRLDEQAFERDYLCASVPAQTNDDRWLNFIVRRGQEAGVTASDAIFSACVPQVLELCPFHLD